MVKAIHHVSLTVSNLDQSIQFYEQLGFHLESVRYENTKAYFRKVINYPDAIVHNALLKGPDPVYLELMQYLKPEGIKLDLATPNVGSTHICFVVDDLQETYEHLSKKGIRFKSEPVLIDSGPNQGGSAVYLLDPDGYTMELYQPN